ncbi:MAG TPA: MerR family DNA-binding transcriptional regulator [Enteractinococcus helveticum]|uniref:MerR family DNA-binding transcriptional regulator n=1 Tax=Enteractinococcus helveticum TaxID=1837282 RepID=A0A921K6R4_9MICC|nr:MerR family DNA-binding transcriptional regulator [Enteractinococcus helveticum]HJF13717.1 MerR family DNA-binding transcriptional regulator [Enteractinococcus helveticum]
MSAAQRSCAGAASPHCDVLAHSQFRGRIRNAACPNLTRRSRTFGAQCKERILLIGEVTARSGISTCMPRHYDSLGLVSASTQTTNGYRSYLAEDSRQLGISG